MKRAVLQFAIILGSLFFVANLFFARTQATKYEGKQIAEEVVRAIVQQGPRAIEAKGDGELGASQLQPLTEFSFLGDQQGLSTFPQNSGVRWVKGKGIRFFHRYRIDCKFERGTRSVLLTLARVGKDWKVLDISLVDDEN
jgi:hypothetical protein